MLAKVTPALSALRTVPLDRLASQPEGGGIDRRSAPPAPPAPRALPLCLLVPAIFQNWIGLSPRKSGGLHTMKGKRRSPSDQDGLGNYLSPRFLRIFADFRRDPSASMGARYVNA